MRFPRASLALLLGVATASPLAAQQNATSPLPPTNQALFAQLKLPTPTEARTGGGEPGPGYWQQRADYDIQVTLDPAADRVTGQEVIHYTNRSPEPLDHIWIQLDQNLFAEGSRGSLVYGGGRWRGSFPGGGLSLETVELRADGTSTPARYVVDGTRMRIDLPSPVPPEGGQADLALAWSFLVPEYGADRMGRYQGKDGWVFEVAQWYPRVAVYDDVDGWNTLPYLGQGEFYLEYGDFDVAITVPRELIVVATGELQNPAEVLTADQRRRLDQARQSGQTVSILAPGEVGDRSTRPSGSGDLTWRFHAENVRDFTWAASKAFIWDATSWEDVLIMSVYPREGLGTKEEPGWEEATAYARHTISYYSDQWFRYPYPVAINVAGVVGGMEYPMIVFCSVDARDHGLFGVTDHELGHTWFPMIVGSDERRWAWMDEGFNTFINHYSNLAFYGDSALADLRTRPDYIVSRELSPIADQVIMTYPDDLRPDGLGFLAYRKPGFGLVMLREVILGPETFDAAFKEYIRRWAYKHPKPADFFRTMEEVSGADLDWFWRGWFETTDLLDQAVDSVQVDSRGSRVYLSNRQGLVMPVPLEMTFADGATRRTQLPVEIWATRDGYTLEVPDRSVVRISLDPDAQLPDVDRTNNAWGKAGGVGGISRKPH